MPNKEILTITFTFPEEDLVDPHILAQTTPYICPTPPPPPTSFQCITWKASMMFTNMYLPDSGLWYDSVLKLK